MVKILTNREIAISCTFAYALLAAAPGAAAAAVASEHGTTSSRAIASQANAVLDAIPSGGSTPTGGRASRAAGVGVPIPEVMAGPAVVATAVRAAVATADRAATGPAFRSVDRHRTIARHPANGPATPSAGGRRGLGVTHDPN